MLAFVGFPGPFELLIIAFILGVPVVVVVVALLLTLRQRRPNELPCPYCGGPAPSWAQFCPCCGRPLQQPPQQPPTEPSP